MPLFHERQYLRSNPIIWMVMISLPAVAVLGYFTEDAAPGGQDWPGMVILFVTEALLLGLFLTACLDTTISSSEIRFRWFPFMLKGRVILWENVAAAEVRKYNPLREYGGWGLKGWSMKNRAFNVDGNVGLQLVMKNGDRILIGTKEREKLEGILFDLKIPTPAHV
jgi:hypothetical protein